MSNLQEPNTKHTTISVPVPRDPAEYSATTHFGQRLRERVPEHLRDRVIRECIERGRVRGVPGGTEDGMVQAFAFDHEIEGRQWTVIVGIMRDACLGGDAKHEAITIYPEGEGDD